MKKIFLSLILLFASNHVLAGYVFLQNLTVKDIRSLDGTTTAKFSFRTDQPIVVPGGLSCMNHFYVVDDTDNPEVALSILLTAITTGKEIEMYIYDDHCSANNRVAVASIRIKK